ncbi:arylsulfatase [Verrucomicrobiales bacterium BCK34]|nr:arylsulfatase [Verrucomicrobiales bacterium BCK34]
MSKTLAFLFVAFAVLTAPLAAAEKPNLIFILADDLGYGDVGCFGQEKIKTPRIDAMAKKGLKLTDFYAGAPVCAPSRSVLMTGQDTGHTWVRGNAGGSDRSAQTLRTADITVAEKLKEAGYATALIGKWGLGEIGSVGHPNRQGFDYFYGYLNQRHAHNFYPKFLVRDETIVPLKNTESPEWVSIREGQGKSDDGAGFATPDGKVEYSHDLIADEALQWIDKKGREDAPFFLYLALTVPHANNEAGRALGNGQEVPDYGIYADKDWPDPDKGQAAMISRMDKDVGRVLDKLDELEISDNTLVIFTSDNGHHKEGGNNPEFFDANGPLKGMKRDLTEGGIRVPTVAYWPGTVKAGTESNHASGFMDWMATACELAGVEAPENLQSISFVPTLKGDTAAQKKPEFLYWEFYERGSKQAVRFGDWKAIRRPMFTGEIELFDLSKDLGEENNLAASHPDKVAEAKAMMEKAHVDNPNWQVRK